MNSRIKELQNLLLDDPNDVFVHYAIALELFKSGRVDEAIEKMELIIELNPEYLPAYFRLGQWFAEQDKIEKAKQILHECLVLAKNQKDTKALGEIQELLLFIEDYED